MEYNTQKRVSYGTKEFLMEQMNEGRSERIQIRIDAYSKSLLKKASEYTKSTISDFILSHSLAAADKIVEEKESITLSNRDWNIFYDALVKPPKLNKKLRAAIRKHKEAHSV